VLLDASEALGRTARIALAPGTPVQQNEVQPALVIRAGQTVRIVATGNGFTASAEGVALTHAAIGQRVQARTVTGQQISGTAREAGLIDVAY
jgi:flagella basal body P-ring formation protein FlgA